MDWQFHCASLPASYPSRYVNREEFKGMDGLTDSWMFYLFTVFPAALILASGKTRGTEKATWFIGACLFSWVAWLLYILLAPQKLKNNYHEGLVAVSVVIGIVASIAASIFFLGNIKFNNLESLGALFVLPVITLLVALGVYVATYIIFGTALNVPTNRIIESVILMAKIKATRLNTVLTACLFLLLIKAIVTQLT